MSTHPLQRTDIIYRSLWNRLAATLMLSILCLQGCRPSFQMSSEDFMLEKLLKTSADGQAISQVVVPDAPSSDVSNSRLSTAASAPPLR